MSRGAPLERARQFLGGPRPWAWAVPLAVVALLPSVHLGLLADDHLLRGNLAHDARLPELGTAWWDAFHFFPPKANEVAVASGYAPWWAEPTARARLLRPLASATHALDFALWPDWPAVMHLECIGWYALVCALAARLYRRWLDGWAAGLATLFYVLDFTHGMAAAWVANRNALLAASFGFVALELHVRGRRWAGALALALAFAAGEVGLTLAALVFASTLTLEAGPPWAKARALAPAALVTGLWGAVQALGHYGFRGSGLYLDPRVHPGAFLAALPAHAALALAADLGGPGPDAWPLLSPGARAAFVGVAATVLTLAAVALRPLWRVDPRVRFFALGSVLAVVPVCATFPSSRLMLVPGFGLLGLLARAVTAWLDREGAPSRARAVFAVLGLTTHLVLAPVLLLATERAAALVDGVVRDLLQGVPDSPQAGEQTVVIANLPDTLFLLYLRPTLATEGRTPPAHLYTLGLGTHTLELTRLDERTVRARDPAGLYGDGFSMLVRPQGVAVKVGERFSSQVADVEVLAVSATGVPTEVVFHFAQSLDDERVRLLQWDGRTLVPLSLAVGATAHLDARLNPLLVPR